MDEDTNEDRLDFLIPSHEFFHQGMVVADCESELFRDGSRGLEGGAFFLATLLNRKEAQTSKGKNAMDSLKDFYHIKADARFCQFFFSKHGLSQSVDNTPDGMKTASTPLKVKYLHDLVSSSLKELLPYFNECDASADTVEILLDHPVQNRRSFQPVSPPPPPVFSPSGTLGASSLITLENAQATASSIVEGLTKENVIAEYLEKTTSSVSCTRTKTAFTCTICKYQSKYETVVLTHIEKCLETHKDSTDAEEDNPSMNNTGKRVAATNAKDVDEEEGATEAKGDKYFNYKNGEFFLDSIFSITTIFEKHGDGLGCLIVSKMLLPIFQGLNHSNYSCSIHRYISRILCEANPREALKIIFERFSNRAGRPGKNVFRDRRMEFRIGVIKKLIENLGPNFNESTVKQVNHSVDIKEELYLMTRRSHGINIRSGRHVPRSDEIDFKTLVQNLTDTEAHKKIEGRVFGDFDFTENIMDDKRFDQASFYRWVARKNEEAKELIEAKRK